MRESGLEESQAGGIDSIRVRIKRETNKIHVTQVRPQSAMYV
jgi:hypothetical protein